jgi:hypothetical protein
MSQVSHVESRSPRPSRRRKPETIPASITGERFTPLLTREAHTFALMRRDRSGPRTYSALCFPGWKQA